MSELKCFTCGWRGEFDQLVRHSKDENLCPDCCEDVVPNDNEFPEDEGN